MIALRMYYAAKPLLPRRFQLALRRWRTRRMLASCANQWPIQPDSDKAPEGWTGWPKRKRFALALTHDVDTAKGQDRCERLIQMEKEAGFRSAFYFVPERYAVRRDLRDYLTSAGFEVGVHGLNHDGKLYSTKEVFDSRALRINQYLRNWQCTGFRSPAMHCNLDRLGTLDITYDASTFDTDPFEPQPKGMGTIFPFWVPRAGGRGGYVELPYTMSQDFTVFILMKEQGIRLWKEKLDWVAQRGGMALLITHPDYMEFDRPPAFDTYPATYYGELLHYIKTEYAGQYWHALPRDIAHFWTTSQIQGKEVTDHAKTCHCTVRP